MYTKCAQNPVFRGIISFQRALASVISEHESVFVSYYNKIK
jgi:hypothetical protein